MCKRVNLFVISFQGPTGIYRDGYSEVFIYEYAIYINEWVEEGRTVFVYFNNTMGDAGNNLKILNGFLYIRISKVKNLKNSNVTFYIQREKEF